MKKFWKKAEESGGKPPRMKRELPRWQQQIRDSVLRRANWLGERPVILCVIIAVVMNILLEIGLRHSLGSALGVIITNPVIFVYNAAIIMLTLCIGLFFKRRNYVILFITLLWLALAVTNFIVLCFRTTPLSASDILIFESVFDIITVYMNWFQIIVIALAILAAIGFMIWLLFRARKLRVQFKAATITTLVTALVILGIMQSANVTNMIPKSFGNLPAAYRDYGFAYCFTLSIFDRGIDKPEEYSDTVVEDIIEEIEDMDKQDAAQGGDEDAIVQDITAPNVLFLQLESFFDPEYLTEVEFSQDPVPNFRALREKYPSGFLTVPALGAGTVNTEFEVITGMSLDYFGTGEYPYKTILMESTCESIAYNLKERGYSAHVIHNNRGSFYDRHAVFPNLGFDSFTSIEYMQDVEYNAMGWARDECLVGEIISSLRSTDGRDLVYTISVQPHGSYPTEVIDPSQTITSSGLMDEERQASMDYYINQLWQEDQFIGQLISAMESYSEPVVLVLFGDHLPNLSLLPEQVETGDLYKTEYVIWSNFKMVAEDKDLQAYQLSAHVLDLLGYDNGILTKLHQLSSDLPMYEQELEILEYDMLYGEKEVYGGTIPYEPTQMAMGSRKILVDGCSNLDGATYISGDNFTLWSLVYVNGKEQETEFISHHTLMLPEQVVESGDRISVYQVAESGEELSWTETYIVP